MITFAPKRVMLATIVASVTAYGHNAGAAEPTLTDVAARNQHAAQETGAEHCQHDNPTIGQELMSDWLADVFRIDQRAVLARMHAR